MLCDLPSLTASENTTTMIDTQKALKRSAFAQEKTTANIRTDQSLDILIAFEPEFDPNQVRPVPAPLRSNQISTSV